MKISAPTVADVDVKLGDVYHDEEAREMHREIPQVKTQFAELKAFKDQVHGLKKSGAGKDDALFLELVETASERLTEATDAFRHLPLGIAELGPKCMLSRKINFYGEFLLASSDQVGDLEESLIAPAIETLGESCRLDQRPDDGSKEERYYQNMRDRRADLLKLYWSKGGQSTFASDRTPTREEAIKATRRIAKKLKGPFLPEGVTWREYAREGYHEEGVSR